MPPNWIDAAINFRWILYETTRCAERLGLDAPAREGWRKVAALLHVPHNERFYLSHAGEDAPPSIGGPAVGTLFWPAEGSFEDLDSHMVLRTFGEIARQRRIEGLLSQGGRAWDAVTGFCYAYMGRGEEACDHLEAFGAAADRRGIEMREHIDHQNYYYLLNHGSLVLLARYMLLQTYRGRIRVFPAVPERWRTPGVSFARLPAEGGYLVSASTGPDGSRVTIFDRADRPLLTLAGPFETLEIVPECLRMEDGEVRFRLEGTPAAPRPRLRVVLPAAISGRDYAVRRGDGSTIVRAREGLGFDVDLPSSIAIGPAKVGPGVS
jgi:hypothetical protein